MMSSTVRSIRTVIALAVVSTPATIISARAAIDNVVNLTGSLPNGTTISPPPASETIVTVPPVAGVDVEKTATLNDDDGSGNLSEFDTITYQVTVENTGNIPINSPTLDDDLTQNGRILALDGAPIVISGDDADPGVLNADETWTYEYTYTIQQVDIDDGNDIENFANFGGTTSEGFVSDDDSVSIALSAVAEIALTKEPITTSYARPEDVVQWEITVANTGGQTLNTIIVADNTADSVECAASGGPTVVSLAPGEDEICIATYEVQPSDIDSEMLVNIASVTAIGGGVRVEADDNAEIPRENANLITVKTVSPADPPEVGDVVTYEIVVTNDGTAEATNITLTDLLPAGLTATANNGNASAGTYDAVSGLWEIASLANGATATLTLEGTVDAGQGGEIITNEVSAAQSAEFDPTTDGDVLVAIITPTALPIIAVDDTLATPVDGGFDNPGVLNVLDGDTLGGSPVDDTLVVVTPVGTLPAGITLNPDGSVDVAAGTPSGTYTFDYQICETADSDNCSIATVTIPVESSLPLISGTVYLDLDQDGTFSGGDATATGYTVELLDQDGNVVGTTTTAPDGTYEFTGFEEGVYDIVFIETATGVGVGYIDDVEVGAGDTIVNQNAPIDPSGVLYDSVTRAPIAGAIVTLVDALGNPIPNECLLPGQQGQVTGANGEYRFDIVAGANAACPIGETEYSIEIVPPAGYTPLPSTNIPPETGALDADVCALDATPGAACNLDTDNTPNPVTSPSPYYLDFLIGAGDPDIVYNHIPIDPVLTPTTSGLSIQKTAGQATARLGDTINYTITVTNNDPVDFTGADIIDTLPVGLTYTPGSATIDGVATEPDVAGRVLTFNSLTIPGNDSVEINISARFGQQITVTELVNTAFAVDEDGNTVTNTARATVRIEVDPVFSCSTIIGKVFDDKNRNGIQDAETSPYTPEPGLAGVRLATVNGLLITTDEFGRFSVPCADIPDADIGSNFLLKLDPRSLPTGYRLTTENPRVVRITQGKMVTMNFGAAVSREVRIELSGSAFENGSATPSNALDSGIDQLVSALETEPSVLRLTYYEDGEGMTLAKQRMAEVEKRVRQRLRRSQLGVDLWIETRILNR